MFALLKLHGGRIASAPVSSFLRIAAIVFLAGIYLLNIFELRLWTEAEIPTGPDQQCYLRQAQLFEEKVAHRIVIGDLALRLDPQCYITATQTLKTQAIKQQKRERAHF